MTDHISTGSLPPSSHESIQLIPPSSIPNSQPPVRQNLDPRLIYNVLKTADEQRQKATRQPELQQFLSLIKADTEGKLVTSGFQSDRVSLPIDSPAAFRRSSSEPLARPPSPILVTSSSAESTKKKTKKQKDKDKDTKEKTDKKRKKDKEKEREKEKSKKDKNRSSSSDGSGSDSDKPAKDNDKKKKDKKRKKDTEESSNKKQRVSSPPEPVTDASALQAMEEGAVAARTATAELVSNAAVAQTKLAAVDNELAELKAATNAKLAQLSNSEEHRRMSEQAAIQAKERQATKETLEKIKKQMLQKEQVLSQLRTKREEIERQERAIMTDKLKQSEYFLTLPTVHARFTFAANNQSIQTISPSISSSANNSPSHSQSAVSSLITQPDDRIKLADENVLQLACLACQTHLRNFIDSMMTVKRKRLEEPIKQAIEHSKNLRVNQPNDDMVDTIRKIELKKELYWEKVAALREAKMKGVDPAEAERAFDLAHQSIDQTSNQPSTLKKRGTEPHLLTVLDFAFALENYRLVNQSNAHTGRLASVHARLPHRIKEWPAEFQPPHPIIRTVNPIINRPANPYGASSPYGSSSYGVSQMSHQPIQNNQSNNPSPASTSHSDDLDALMDMDAGD